MSEIITGRASSFSPAGGAGISNGTGPKPTYTVAMAIFSCKTGPAKIRVFDDTALAGALAPDDPSLDPILTVQLASGQSWSPPIGKGRVLGLQRGLFYLVDSGADVFVGFYQV